MKTRNWLITISLCLSMLLLLGALAITPPAPVAAGPQPQATVEPSPRYGHTLVTISDTVYLFGGTDITLTQGLRSDRLQPAGDLLNDLWGYTDKDQDWKKLEPSGTVPSPRHSHAATTLGGLMYVYGGTDGTNVFNDLWEYNPATNQWMQKPWTGPYNAPHVYDNTLTGGSVGSDYLYLYGGRDQNGNLRTASYRYNVKTGEASSIWSPDSPGARAGHSVIQYNGKFYLFGGIGGEPPTYQDDVWVFDPYSVQWTKLEPRGDVLAGFPGPRAYAAAVEIDGKIHIIGGRNNNGAVNPGDSWVFYPEKNGGNGEWMLCRGCVPSGMRERLAAAALGMDMNAQMRTAQTSSQAILIFGGLRNGTPIAETIVFQPFDRLYLPLVTR